MSELLTGGTIGHTALKGLKEQRQRIMNSWGELGFLDGLNGHVNENIAQLYCCQASTLINEVTTGDTESTPPLPKDLHTYIKRDNEESEGTSTDSPTI